MIDVIFGGTHVCVLLNFGPGVTRWRYHNNHRFIMRTDNVSKVTLSVQNSLSIIMCKFRAVQSKTEGMAASVRVFFEHPSYNRGMTFAHAGILLSFMLQIDVYLMTLKDFDYFCSL